MNIKYSLVKGIVMFSIFILLTPVALGSAFIGLIELSVASEPEIRDSSMAVNSPAVGVNIFASLPKKAPSIDVGITSEDARAEIVRQYLARYNSPLEAYANFMVEVADQHGLDFRLLAAIAQQESNLCKFIPEGSYNCWGWGIHSRGSLGFSSYEEGIKTVSEGLKNNYIDEGFDTPLKIMSKYTPMSDGSWARGVEQFMQEML